MDCREFRNKHVGYVDDLLSGVEMEAMRAHLAVCGQCARQDTAIRRSLLLVRNLPAIEPSVRFRQRLNARLAELGPPRPLHADRYVRSAIFSAPALGAFAAMAAGLGVVTVMAVHTTRYFAPEPLPAVAQPVAMRVETAAPPVVPLANAAYVAAVPTGIPIWPAVLMMGESPIRFANLELQEPDSR